jgi:hypothetical protein
MRLNTMTRDTRESRSKVPAEARRAVKKRVDTAMIRATVPSMVSRSFIRPIDMALVAIGRREIGREDIGFMLYVYNALLF